MSLNEWFSHVWKSSCVTANWPEVQILHVSPQLNAVKQAGLHSRTTLAYPSSGIRYGLCFTSMHVILMYAAPKFQQQTVCGWLAQKLAILLILSGWIDVNFVWGANSSVFITRRTANAQNPPRIAFRCDASGRGQAQHHRLLDFYNVTTALILSIDIGKFQIILWSLNSQQT